MFMDIHCIQQVPPSNINRDDTGSPKTAYVGGALRSRVSSQAWKRAMRGVFGDMLDSSKFLKISVPLYGTIFEMRFMTLA